MPIHDPKGAEAASFPAHGEPDEEHCGDYVIGYGKPPTHSRFKAGASGNPKGRPKGAVGLKSLVRAFMSEKVPVRAGGDATKMSRAETLLHKAFELALKGNLRAQLQLLRLYAEAVPDESDEPPRDEAEESALRLKRMALQFLEDAREARLAIDASSE